MNIKNLYGQDGLDKIITELEVALQLDGRDYEEESFSDILNNVYKRINRQYQLDFKMGKICDPIFETNKFFDSASLFVDNIALIHAKLSAYCHIVRYGLHTDVLLSNINYMSVQQSTMLQVLKELQLESCIPSVEEPVRVLENRIQTIRISREKRLFMLLLIAYEIGLYEVVATIAEILYLGGIL